MTTPITPSPNLADERAGKPYTPGVHPETDAWFTSFFIENHLDYFTYPDHASSPEQIRFMVYTEGAERYYPCSDEMFAAIMTRNHAAFLQKRYNEALQRILTLIDQTIEDPYEKAYLESLIVTKYKHETRDEIMIPSRLEKRLMKIFIKRTQIEDPYTAEKCRCNRRAAAALASEAFKRALNHIESSEFQSLPETLSAIKSRLESITLKRLLTVLSQPSLWTSDEAMQYDQKDFSELFDRPFVGNGVAPLFSFLGIDGADPGPRKSRKILWLADESGEVMVDLAIIGYLADLGHKIIVAFKEGPLFTKPDYYDTQDDPYLQRALAHAVSIDDRNLSKNQLVGMLRSDNKVFVISDGTSEHLNLLLASTTFARVFKEVDAVIARGEEQRCRFFEVRFQFTQDIYSISRASEPALSIVFKPRHPAVIKFSHEDLEQKAHAIVQRMKDARKNGMSVMFYSGIIGSIPGKVDTAKKIMSVFVAHLANQAPQTLIINPSEHFEPGMDADDLMYMWEIVQTSGYIDTWRFQTNEDIARAFQIIDKKMPPEWVGKDATFSTGCTKEMHIALAVQKQYPEMQIIGPSREKFMRREEYGIGMMYDRRLEKSKN